jgi:hypothetical protein
MSNSVRTTRFLNHIQQVRSKSKVCKAIYSVVDRISVIVYRLLLLQSHYLIRQNK